MKVICTLFFYCLLTLNVWAQKTLTSIPTSIDKSAKYMFYLHGRIIEEQSVNAVSADYGPYEYLAILDTLSAHNFVVISEARAKNTNQLIYAENIATQIDSLLHKGVPAKNIFVMGASKGAYITLLTARKVQNKYVNYIVLGVCAREEVNYWLEDKTEFCGNFLSIYEDSDAFGGSCGFLLGQGVCISRFEEVKLNMGNRHGFLYKPYKEWVDPVMKW